MRPLEGVKVVDLTTCLAVPTMVCVLGERGANCIKIESHKGDLARTQGAVFNMPFTDDENLASGVANLNKKFITLNLKTEKGPEICYKFLEEADVFVTNTRTKSLVESGLDYNTLKEKFPKLIFVQVLGYGEKGPEEDTAGFDVTCYMARGGVFGTTVNRGNAFIIPANGFGDFQVVMSLISGICAVLYRREKTGEGDRVTIGLHHAAVYVLNTGLISAQYGNQYLKNRKEVSNPFNNVFRTRDNKWVCICCPGYDRNYEKMFTFLGCPEMLEKEQYRHCADVNNNHLNKDVTDVLDGATVKIDRDDLMKMLKENDMSCEAAYEPLDIYEDEQTWANDVLTRIPYPSGRKIMPTDPVGFASLGKPDYAIGGMQGAHTVEIMKHLGYSDEQIEETIVSGAVGGATELKPL